ncbi:hypothetical protein D3C80_652610 [compost metagenome]
MPASNIHDAIHMAEYQARHWRPHQPRERRSQEQDGRNATTVVLRKPQRQVIENTRGKASFHRPDNETQRVELPFSGDEGHHRRGQPPGDHDAGNPAARADLVQHQVAGHFEQHIANHEQAGAQAIGGIAEAQVSLQLELGKTDVDAVEKGEQVADHNQWHEAPGDFTDQGLFHIDGSRQGCPFEDIGFHGISTWAAPWGWPLVFVMWCADGVSRAIRRAGRAGRNCARPWQPDRAGRGPAVPARCAIAATGAAGRCRWGCPLLRRG